MSKTTIPASNGYPVTTRQFSWADMVMRAWGAEWAAPDHGVYEWSNGRKFDSTDQYGGGRVGSGIYNGGAGGGPSPPPPPGPPPPPSSGFVLMESDATPQLLEAGGNVLTESGS